MNEWIYIYIYKRIQSIYLFIFQSNMFGSFFLLGSPAERHQRTFLGYCGCSYLGRKFWSERQFWVFRYYYSIFFLLFLSIIYYLLSIIYYLLAIIYYLLSIIYCLLSIIYYLLSLFYISCIYLIYHMYIHIYIYNTVLHTTNHQIDWYSRRYRIGCTGDPTAEDFWERDI